MEHSKHVWRMAIIVVGAIIGFVFVRMALIPESYGAYGSYRFADVADQMAIEPQHGEMQGCNECHDDMVEILLAGHHKTVACENCHAPMATHVKDEDKEWDMHINKTGDWCIRCHLDVPARPRSQPMIDPVTHLRDVGEEQEGRDWSDQVCFECHNPHDPNDEAGSEPMDDSSESDDDSEEE